MLSSSYLHKGRKKTYPNVSFFMPSHAMIEGMKFPERQAVNAIAATAKSGKAVADHCLSCMFVIIDHPISLAQLALVCFGHAFCQLQSFLPLPAHKNLFFCQWEIESVYLKHAWR